MNNKELSELDHKQWSIYREKNKDKIMNKYPNHNFEVRIKVMKDFKRILEEEQVTLFLAGGSLLGFYRDNDFIAWDNDVDMDVLAEELEPKFEIVKEKLLKMGYLVRTIKEYPSMKINVYHEGEKIGILALYLNKEKNVRYRTDYVWPAEIYEEQNRETVVFKNVIFEAPDVEKYVFHTYGESWNKPITKDKNYLSKKVFLRNMR